LQRLGEDKSPQDELTYSYYEESNKLKNVDGSTTENYTYDQIGNLIKDDAEGIDSIVWTPYGKVRAVFKDDNTEVHFRYDASGNRIAKITDSDTTIYVRDASGNVMGVYNNKALKEQAIYGSSRLGLINYASQTAYRTLGGKKYELSNHLGNVLTVVSDNIHLDQDSTWTTAINTTDYYPFGLAMDGRTVQDSTYRYGFNGMEGDDEVNGPGRSYTTEFRQYDPVVGRWWGVDPLADAPEQIDKSPYGAFWNNPIRYNDPDGRCPNCITGLIGAGVGALVGGGIEVATQLYNSGSVTDWSGVGGSALQGGITGGAAGFTGGASLVVTAGVAGTANAVGGAANRAIQGQETTIGDVALDATIGSALGAGGKLVGNVVSGAVDDLSNAVKGKLGEGLTNAKYLGKGYINTGKAVVETGNKTATGRVQVAKYDHAFKNPFTGKQLTVESKFNTSGLTGNQKAAAGNVTTPGGLIISNPISQHVGQAAGAATSGTGAGVVTQKERDY